MQTALAKRIDELVEIGWEPVTTTETSASLIGRRPFSWWLFLLLPLHWMMGPVQGAIVNWCGHRYGYRNFETTRDDRSRNTLILDFVTLGELFQNNHHKYGMSPNFAARWFELDPAYLVIKLFAWAGIVDLGPSPQYPRYPAAVARATES